MLAGFNWEREREIILFTKANIQYQYHKTITSGRLPEGITHQAGCLQTAERIDLAFGMWASFHPSYTVLKGNSVISKIRAIPSGTLS